MKPIRLNILFKLKKLAKVPEGVVVPRWLRIIRAIFFPLESWYCHQAGIKYDPLRNLYIFHSVKITADFFDELGRMQDNNRVNFFLVKEGDVITITTMP